MVLFWLLPETRGREPEDLWPTTWTGLPPLATSRCLEAAGDSLTDWSAGLHPQV